MLYNIVFSFYIVQNFKQSTHSELNGALYQELNNALKELLMLWFTVGFLNLERITWNSPCDLVQKVRACLLLVIIICYLTLSSNC